MPLFRAEIKITVMGKGCSPQTVSTGPDAAGISKKMNPLGSTTGRLVFSSQRGILQSIINELAS
jgi:hypothetical protein